MKAKTSASWRFRKAGGVVLDQEGLRPRRIDGVSPNPRAGKD